MAVVRWARTIGFELVYTHVFFFQAEDGIRDYKVTGVQTCALPICVLLIVSPDAKIPPEEVQKFFEGLSQKNTLCVLPGDKTAMGSVENAARQLYAAQKDRKSVV